MPEGIFNISRGIRQGDPLSPSLYIIMAEAFGRAVADVHKNQNSSGITVTRNMRNITHQQYVDDTILPGKSIVEEALGLKTIIKAYMEASAQI